MPFSVIGWTRQSHSQGDLDCRTGLCWGIFLYATTIMTWPKVQSESCSVAKWLKKKKNQQNLLLYHLRCDVCFLYCPCSIWITDWAQAGGAEGEASTAGLGCNSYAFCCVAGPACRVTTWLRHCERQQICCHSDLKKQNGNKLYTQYLLEGLRAKDKQKLGNMLEGRKIKVVNVWISFQMFSYQWTICDTSYINTIW